MTRYESGLPGKTDDGLGVGHVVMIVALYLAFCTPARKPDPVRAVAPGPTRAARAAAAGCPVVYRGER